MKLVFYKRLINEDSVLQKDLKMKTLILTTIATLAFGLSAFASDEAFQQGADQLNEVMRCQSLTVQPDNGLTVTVLTGGIAGLTQVRVERFFIAHREVKTYLVKAIPANPRRAGDATALVGNGIRLTVNFTTLLPNGEHYGTLQTFKNDMGLTEELACSSMHQNPQVNYTY